MKYVHVLVAALLLVGASAFPLSLSSDDEPNELDRELIDFGRLLPTDKLVKVIEEHAEDPELWEVFDYLLSDDFHKLVYAAEDLHEFHRYVLYLQKAGYNAIRELRQTHESLGMKEYVPPKHPDEFKANMKKGGGFNGFIDDLTALIPKQEAKELHAKKVKESPVFAKFSAAVKSPKFAEIRANLHVKEPMQNLVREAKANGFDFQKYYGFRYQLLGFV